MQRTAEIQLRVMFATPLVAASIVIGLWLAVSAARENLRFAHATDQILATVASARDMRSVSNPERAADVLLERLSHSEKMNVVSAPDSSHFMVNPWGGRLAVALPPSLQTLAIDSWLSSASCRRLIDFFGKDAVSLGIVRVEVRDDDSVDPAGRLIYAAPSDGAPGKVNPELVKAGCGNAPLVVLSLAFRLR